MFVLSHEGRERLLPWQQTLSDLNLSKRLLEQAFFDGCPIDIAVKSLDVFGSVGRYVIEQESMLPYVHYEQRLEAGNIAFFV